LLGNPSEDGGFLLVLITVVVDVVGINIGINVGIGVGIRIDVGESKEGREGGRRNEDRLSLLCRKICGVPFYQLSSLIQSNRAAKADVL
jgi:hypothetical protein